MPIELSWLVDHSVSTFRAAEAVAAGLQLADAELAGALAEPTAALRSCLSAAAVPERSFWQHVVPQSAGIDSNRELANVVLTKAFGMHQEVLTLSVAGHLADLDAAVRELRPDLTETVSGNSSRIRSAWDSQGAVLLDEVGRFTEERLLVGSAKVLLSYPALGGAGAAHLLYNCTSIEVAAIDPSTDLPEVLRLVWLLSQLNMDVPVLSETVRRDRLPKVASLSMLPPALVAAEQMHLASFNEQSLRQAIEQWAPQLGAAESLSDTVWQWWHTYLGSRPAWNVGVGALDQMLD